VNATLDVAPHDPAFRKVVAEVRIGIEAFFLVCVRAGQAGGTITRSMPAETLSQNLLGVPSMTRHFTSLPFTRNVNDLPQAGATTTSVGSPSIRDTAESYGPRPRSPGGLQLLGGHAAALPVSGRIALSMIRQWPAVSDASKRSKAFR
jgi:hypothetical protein